MATFSENLKHLRKHLGFTQGEFAVKLNIHRVTLAKYEKGSLSPSYEMLGRVCSAFHISMGWLVSGEGSMMDVTRAGAMRVGESLGTYIDPVEVELGEIISTLRRNGKLREIVLAMLRVAKNKGGR